MDALRSLWRRLRARIARRRLDEELRHEMEHHLAARTQALVAEGMDPHDAVREARRQFGNLTSIAERTREIRGFPGLESFVQDVRYGVRLLARAPLFTFVSVASIACGLTAAIGIFVGANAFLLRPLAGANATVYRIFTASRQHGSYEANSYADFRNFSALDLFASTCATARVRANLTVGNQSRAWPGAVFSDGCFGLLGLRAHRGRLLGRGNDPEVVISYALWNRQFAGDSAIVGAHVLVNGMPATIVGVAPRGFSGTSLDGSAEFWVRADQFRALLAEGALEDRRHRVFTVFAQLRDGVTPAQAQTALTTLALSLQREDPRAWTTAAGTVRRVTIMDETESRFAGAPAGAVSGLILALAAAIGGIVFIASINVATLLLARGASRTRELTVRLAIGASRARLLCQLATESAVIAALGTALALAAIAAGLRVFEARRPEELPGMHLAIDWHVLVFAIVIAAAVTIFCGLLPATHVVRLAIAEGLKGQAAKLRTKWLRAGTRETLIVVQVAASVALLIVSALFARGFAVAANTSPGFTIDGLVTVGIDIGTLKSDAAARTAERLVEAISAVPGVDAPSISQVMLLTGSSMTFSLADDSGSSREVEGDLISPQHLRTIGIVLRRGRYFTEEDRSGAPAVAVVSETFAKTMLRTIEAVGKTIKIDGKIMEVVGVVADARYRSVSEPYRPVVYLPFAQYPQRHFLIHVRTSGRGETLAAIDAAARSVDPRILVDGAVPLARRLDEIRMPERAAGWIGGAAGAAQLALVLMAVWGLVAYAVARRTQEIGVRVALGATPNGVVVMLMRPALLLIAAGAAIGSLAGIAGGTLMQAEFIGLAELEPLRAAPYILGILAVAAAAALFPALRATRVDPIQALRSE